jgi:thymidylate synthase
MNSYERQYLKLLEELVSKANRANAGKARWRTDLQQVGSVAVFVREMRFRPAEEFPLLTTKKMPFKTIVVELLWYLTGSSRVDFLREHKVTIWDEWATKEVAELYGLPEGDLGRIYGPQWVRWGARDGREINQVANLVEGLIKSPDSRRHKVIAWNPEDVNKVAVAPCHGDFKCFVEDGELSLHMVQRSADMFLGVPFNIACYSALLMMLAQVTGLKTGEFIHTLQDTHLYRNHVEQARLQLTRPTLPLSRLLINPEVKDIFGFTPGDFKIQGYASHEGIRAEVGV